MSVETFFTVSEERNNLKQENFKLQENYTIINKRLDESVNLLKQVRNLQSEDLRMSELEQTISIFLEKYGFEIIK